MKELRLQKFLAQAGIASRRKAEELIKQGAVTVNGTKVVEMGIKISDSDIVEVSGKKVSTVTKKIYIMLNKPVGYVSTVKDQFNRPTVLDLLKDIKERIYPVGRLDYETSGLLLLSNDGDFTYKITHPKHEYEKVYIADIEGIPTEEELSIFERGVNIQDQVTAPAKIRIVKRNEKNSTVEITIHEGKNRQVRVMCEAIDHPVRKLKRVSVGKLKLGDLKEGSWRLLTEEEIDSL